MVTRFPMSAKALALLALSYPQLAAAQDSGGFTGAEVLAWSEAEQNSFFQTNVTMIGFVASQIPAHAVIAECVSGWYWKEAAANPERNEGIRDALRRFTDYHPQMVILAVVEKACGKFGPS